MPVPPRPLEERFWAKVDKSGDCWLFTGAVRKGGQGQGGGYGRIWDGKKVQYAHRVSYELLVGPVPEGSDLDHLCRNRACVFPEHLEPVTRRENLLRGQTIAAKNAAKTHCPKGHPYDYITSQGARWCSICRAAAERKYYNRHRRKVAG